MFQKPLRYDFMLPYRKENNRINYSIIKCDKKWQRKEKCKHQRHIGFFFSVCIKPRQNEFVLHNKGATVFFQQKIFRIWILLFLIKRFIFDCFCQYRSSKKLSLGIKILTPKNSRTTVTECKLCLTLHEQIDISERTYITLETSMGSLN